VEWGVAVETVIVCCIDLIDSRNLDVEECSILSCWILRVL
jgi:hypothetical protein